MAKLGVAPAQTASKGQHARPAQRVVHHGEPDRVHRHRRVTSQRRRCSAPCPVPSGTRVGSIEPLGDSPAQTAHAHALRTCDAGSDPPEDPNWPGVLAGPAWRRRIGSRASAKRLRALRGRNGGASRPCIRGGVRECIRRCRTRGSGRASGDRRARCSGDSTSLEHGRFRTEGREC